MATATLRAPVSAELEIKKSRFIGLAMPVEDRAMAMRVIARLRAEHPNATHLCWALQAGGHSGMSDDGEPSGTAGRPILAVLRHHDLDDTLGVVVRYFGGIKLGAGGLTRAYTHAIAAALMHAERIARVARITLALVADYADAARIRRWAESAGHTLSDTAHGANVTLTLRLARADEAAARQALRDLTRGRILIREISGPPAAP